MLMVVAGKRYKARSIYELTLEHLIALEAETTEMGHRLNLTIMEEYFQEVEKITHKDPKEQARLRGHSPIASWTFVINVFCAMRVAGDIDTFADALKFTTGDVTFLREPGDPDELEALGVAEAAPDPTKRRKPTTPKAGSHAAKESRRTTQAAKSQAAKSPKVSTVASPS